MVLSSPTSLQVVLTLTELTIDFSSIVEKFFRPDDFDLLCSSLSIVRNWVPGMADISLPHVLFLCVVANTVAHCNLGKTQPFLARARTKRCYFSSIRTILDHLIHRT